MVLPATSPIAPDVFSKERRVSHHRKRHVWRYVTALQFIVCTPWNEPFLRCALCTWCTTCTWNYYIVVATTAPAIPPAALCLLLRQERACRTLLFGHSIITILARFGLSPAARRARATETRALSGQMHPINRRTRKPWETPSAGGVETPKQQPLHNSCL